MNTQHDPERDPLGLRTLPQLAPPGDGWPAIESGLARHSRRRLATASLAAAATIALAIGIGLELPRPAPSDTASGFTQGSHSANRPLLAVPMQATGSVAGSGDGALSVDLRSEPASLETLIALSQRLERNLRILRDRVGAMPAEALVYQVELEDLVAQVDELISLQPGRADLWSQRVGLLLDLNQLYSIELRREYGTLASL